MPVRPLPGRRTFHQMAGRGLRGLARRALNGLGDAMLSSSLQQLAANAGFTGSDLSVAVAVALAESGGNPLAYNPETASNTPQGQGSFGLWQIYRKSHPEFSSWNLFDPQANANAAYQVYRAAGSSFTPWSTYKSGRYVQFLAAQQPPAGTPEPPLTIDNSTGQPIQDATPTPGTIPDDAIAAGIPAGLPVASGNAPNYLLLTGLALGAYFIADSFFGD